MIEHESHSHANHTGLPWVDLILAGCAIFISIVSLVVSIHHGHTMEALVAANEKQVEASTLPILRFGTGNEMDNAKAIHFDLRNGGTGPAIVEWLRVKWNGEPTNGPGDLLDRCCGMHHKTVSIYQSIASGNTLPASQSVTILAIRASDIDVNLYNRLNTERFQVEPEACYCSVLDECWTTDFQVRPKKVNSCEAIPDHQRW